MGSNYCILCKKDHTLVNCNEFKELTINDRVDFIRKNKLCNNCLKAGHFYKKCKGFPCKRCKMRHNELVHFEKKDKLPSTSSESNSKVLTSRWTNQQMLLLTARLQVYDNSGKPHIIRTLLECGAQSNFITSSLCENLGLRKDKFFH